MRVHQTAFVLSTCMLLLAPAVRATVTVTNRQSFVTATAHAQDSDDDATDNDLVSNSDDPFDESVSATMDLGQAAASGSASQTSNLTLSGTGQFFRADASGASTGEVNANNEADSEAQADIDVNSQFQLNINSDGAFTYVISGDIQYSGRGLTGVFLFTSTFTSLLPSAAPGPYSATGTLPAGDYIFQVTSNVQADTANGDTGGQASYTNLVFAVPEPGSLTLTVAAGLTLARRRPRFTRAF